MDPKILRLREIKPEDMMKATHEDSKHFMELGHSAGKRGYPVKMPKE